MKTMTDTTSDAHALQVRLQREMPPARKMALLADLIRTSRALALSGLRAQYPDATEADRHRLLADRLLGKELAATVYGPAPELNGAPDAV